MADATLVSEDIKDGEKLVGALLKTKEPLYAAFWSYLPLAGEHRLFLSSPAFDRRPPIEAYQELQRVMKAAKVKLSVDRITLLRASDPVIRALTRAMTIEGIGHMIIRESIFNGVRFEDAVVYHVEGPNRPPSLE